MSNSNAHDHRNLPLVLLGGGGGTLKGGRHLKYKDGTISFKLTRERNGEKMAMPYEGVLGGDTIKGKMGFGNRARDWEAQRVKE